MEYQDILDINKHIKSQNQIKNTFSKHSVINFKDYFKIPEGLDMDLIKGILFVVGIIIGIGVSLLLATIFFKALSEVRKLGKGDEAGIEELKKCGWCFLILALFIPAYFYVLTLIFAVQLV